MSQTIVRKNESLDDALRRFKRSVTKAGTLQEARKREHYEKPSVKRKRKSASYRPKLINVRPSDIEATPVVLRHTQGFPDSL